MRHVEAREPAVAEREPGAAAIEHEPEHRRVPEAGERRLVDCPGPVGSRRHDRRLAPLIQVHATFRIADQEAEVAGEVLADHVVERGIADEEASGGVVPEHPCLFGPGGEERYAADVDHGHTTRRETVFLAQAFYPHRGPLRAGAGRRGRHEAEQAAATRSAPDRAVRVLEERPYFRVRVVDPALVDPVALRPPERGDPVEQPNPDTGRIEAGDERGVRPEGEVLALLDRDRLRALDRVQRAAARREQHGAARRVRVVHRRERPALSAWSSDVLEVGPHCSVGRLRNQVEDTRLGAVGTCGPGSAGPPASRR